MRWSTEIEKKLNVSDEEFLKRNRNRIMDIDKFLPLSFLDNPKTISLIRLRRWLINACEDAGLGSLAEITVMDNLSDYNTSRGIRGNFQLSLITQRREWKDQTNSEQKRSFWKNVIQGKKEAEQYESMEG